jgi:hypothetical protein
MKAKVIIENGETTIILTPENDFDRDILEKAYTAKNKFDLHTSVDANYRYGSYENHKMVVSIKKID